MNKKIRREREEYEGEETEKGRLKLRKERKKYIVGMKEIGLCDYFERRTFI